MRFTPHYPTVRGDAPQEPSKSTLSGRTQAVATHNPQNHTHARVIRPAKSSRRDVKRRENRRYLVVLFRARRSSHTTARPFRASHAHLTGAQRIATSLIGQERTATRLTPPSSKIQTGTCVSDRDRTHIRIVQKRLRGRGRAKALRCPRGGSSSPCRPRGARARVFEIHIKSCLSQRHHWLS